MINNRFPELLIFSRVLEVLKAQGFDAGVMPSTFHTGLVGAGSGPTTTQGVVYTLTYEFDNALQPNERLFVDLDARFQLVQCLRSGQKVPKQQWLRDLRTITGSEDHELAFHGLCLNNTQASGEKQLSRLLYALDLEAIREFFRGPVVCNSCRDMELEVHDPWAHRDCQSNTNMYFISQHGRGLVHDVWFEAAQSLGDASEAMRSLTESMSRLSMSRISQVDES